MIRVTRAKNNEKDSIEQAYSWAAKRCAGREQCRSDLLPGLAQRGIKGEEADSLLNRLEEEGYINEARYAHAFVHDRVRYDRWGRVKIRYALRNKGLSDNDIEAALQSEVDETEYEETLRQLLDTKLRTTSAPSPSLLRQKLIRFAAGRGFEADIIYSVLEILTKD